MPGAAARRKGIGFERELVEYFRLLLPQAQVHRVPLSGAAEGFKGDIRIVLGDKVFLVEAKRRRKIAQMFSKIEGGIGAIREDRGYTYFIVPAPVLIELINAVRGGLTWTGLKSLFLTFGSSILLSMLYLFGHA